MLEYFGAQELGNFCSGSVGWMGGSGWMGLDGSGLMGGWMGVRVGGWVDG